MSEAEISFSEMFPEADDLKVFETTTYALAKSLFEFLECPSAMENQTDFMAKLIQFVHENIDLLVYISRLIEDLDHEDDEPEPHNAEQT